VELTEIAVLLVAFMKQFTKFMIVALLPVIESTLAEFVCNLIPEIEAVPAKEAVNVPTIVTLGVVASQLYADKLILADSVRFSVYVPG
jgi:hypothetical protein